MLHLWLKIVLAAILLISCLVLTFCWALAFAGGWVAPFAKGIETAGVISFLGTVASGFGLGLVFLSEARRKH